MSDVVVDSSVVAKWVLPEVDSPQAHRVMSETVATAGRLIVVDLAFAEVANAIWKRQRQRLITLEEARQLLDQLLLIPVQVEPATRLIPAAFEIAARYDRSLYDALFVALSHDLGTRGVTADEPLYNVMHISHPNLVLLRDW